MRYQRAAQPLKLDGLDAARSFFAGCFAESDPARECLWVAHLDDFWNCVHLSRHEGSEDATSLPVRTIITDAAQHRSSAIVLAHNHPSGDPSPSPSDCIGTRRLAAAAESLDCNLIDHLIFAGSRSVSLRSLGYL